MLRRLALVLSASSVVTSACSLFLSADEFAGGETPPAPGADASTTTDTGSDGPSTPTTDARADDADAAAPPPFCTSLSPQPTFCNDFDLSTKADDGFTFQLTSDTTTTIALDHALFVTPKTSLRMQLPAGVPGTSKGFVARQGYVANANVSTRMAVETKMRLEAVDAFTQPGLVFLQLGDGDVTFRASRMGTSVSQDITNDAGYSSKAKDLGLVFPFQKWVKLEMVVTFVGSAASLTVAIDETPVLTDFALDAFYKPQLATRFSLGAVYYTNATVQATDVRFDDVRFDVN